MIFALTIDTAYLVNDDVDDDDDTGNMSTCDMQGTDDEVSEIFKQQVTL